MKYCLKFGIGVLLIFLSFLVFTSVALAGPEELAEIQAAIKAKGALWTAGENWVSRLSPQERRKLLGEKTLEFGIVEPIPPSPPLTLAYPSAIDWRNKDGKNWITPIKDQQYCGSCVAFGSVATLESLARIETNQPDLNIDLSEMHLFNCGGGSCSDGWTNSSAVSYLKLNGVPDDACWPYDDVNMSCSNTCPNWQTRAYKITNYGSISGIEACKTYVAIAPILVAFEVYEDFYAYTGGIYEHTWGAYEGGHAVSIVGYGTTGNVSYWIVKNSWGPSWGEAGFFKIKMGQCNIENRSSYWMSGAILPGEPSYTYCFKDTLYAPQYQFNLESGKYLRGQAILAGNASFPAPLTGYFIGGYAYFSIAYRGDAGLRFYRVSAGTKKGETWGIRDADATYYDNPHAATLGVCTPALNSEDSELGDSGAEE